MASIAEGEWAEAVIAGLSSDGGAEKSFGVGASKAQPVRISESRI
jgi:hypothetical protein